MVKACFVSKMAVLRDRTMTAETVLDNIRFTEAERAEIFLGKRDAVSSRLQKVVTALRGISKAREEKRIKQPTR